MKSRTWFWVVGSLVVTIAGVARGADTKAAAGKPAEPEKSRTVVNGHILSLATPAGWKGQSKGNDSSWAGAWLSPGGTTLIVTATARAESKPFELDKRLDAMLPQLTAKPSPWLKPATGAGEAAFDGFPAVGRRLAGEKEGEKQLGVAQLVDAGPATISVLVFGPEKTFADDWKAATVALQQLAIDGAKGPFDYTAAKSVRPPVTRPAVAPAPAAGGANGLTVGRLTFTPPAKWEVHKDDKRTLLVPPGSKLDNPAATITLLPPASAGGNKLADWLDAFTTTAHQNYTVRQKKDPKPANGPGGSSVLTQVFVLAPKSNPKRTEYRVYAAIGIGDAVQVVLYASPDAETFKAHFPELQRVIEDAKLVDAAANP